MSVRGVEVIHGNSQMTDSRVFHLVRATRPFRRDDLQHGAVGGLDEIITGVGEVDMKLQMIHVPLGKAFRIRRSDSGVFQSFEHTRIVSGPDYRIPQTNTGGLRGGSEVLLLAVVSTGIKSAPCAAPALLRVTPARPQT